MKSVLEERCMVISFRKQMLETLPPKINKYMEYVGRHHNNLLNTLTYAQKEILEKFDDRWNEYVSLSEKSIFVYAFKLGTRIGIGIMYSAKE